jgi:hypothetical protein
MAKAAANQKKNPHLAPSRSSAHRILTSALALSFLLLLCTRTPASGLEPLYLTKGEIEFLCGIRVPEKWFPVRFREDLEHIDDSEHGSWIREASRSLRWNACCMLNGSPAARDPYRRCLYITDRKETELNFVVTWSRRFGAVQLKSLEHDPEPGPRTATYSDLRIIRSDFPSLQVVQEFYELNNLHEGLRLDWSWTIEQADEVLQEHGLRPIRTSFGSGWLMGQDAYLPQWEGSCTKGGPWECLLSDTLRASLYRIPRDAGRTVDVRTLDSTPYDDPIYILAYDSLSRTLKALWEYTALPSMRLWLPPGTRSRELSSNALQARIPSVKSWETKSQELDSAVVPTDWLEGRGSKYTYWREKFEAEGRYGAISKFWTNAEGVEYRVFDLGPESYAITESLPEGRLQRIFHFMGINGTAEYRPPSAPSVEISTSSPARWFTSTPVEISWKTGGIIEIGEVTAGDEPIEPIAGQDDEGTVTISSDKLFLHLSARVENEAGSANDSLVLPAILPIVGIVAGVGAACSFFIFLLRLSSSKRSRRKLRETMEFKRDLEHGDILIEEGLLEDARLHIATLVKKHPEHKAKIHDLQRKLQAALLRNQQAAHSSEKAIPADIKARIDPKTGHLDLQAHQPPQEEDQ